MKACCLQNLSNIVLLYSRLKGQCHEIIFTRFFHQFYYSCLTRDMYSTRILNFDEFSQCKSPERKLAGVGYNCESGLPVVVYTGVSGLTGVGYTGKFPVVVYTGGCLDSPVQATPASLDSIVQPTLVSTDNRYGLHRESTQILFSLKLTGVGYAGDSGFTGVGYTDESGLTAPVQATSENVINTTYRPGRCLLTKKEG